MAPICPTAQRQLQAQYSRKPEQFCPSLPEGPHVHREHSQHFLGCCCWITNLGCSRSVTEQVTQAQSPKPHVCVCACGAGLVLDTELQLSTQQALRKWREPPVCGSGCLIQWYVPSIGTGQEYPIPCGRGVDHRYP